MQEQGSRNMEQGADASTHREWTITVHEEPHQDGGGYWAEIAELPGCYALGESIHDLRIDLNEAIASHIGALQQVGRAVPAMFHVPASLFPREVVQGG